MNRRAHSTVVLVLALTAAAGACSGNGSDGGTGEPDSSTGVDAAEDTTVADAPADVSDAGQDSIALDAEVDADVLDAGSDADVLDAAADADAEPDASVDAGLRFVVVSCWTQQGPTSRSTWIDSEGNRYLSNLRGPGAGNPFPAPAPPGWPAPYAKLSAAQLDELLNAAYALDSSVAGYTTKVGPIFHMLTWTGDLRSAGVYQRPGVLVDSLTDGVSFGKETVVLHNDPVAVVVRIGRCFSVTH